MIIDVTNYTAHRPREGDELLRRCTGCRHLAKPDPKCQACGGSGWQPTGDFVVRIRSNGTLRLLRHTATGKPYEVDYGPKQKLRWERYFEDGGRILRRDD